MTNRLELLIDRVEPTLRGKDRQRRPHTLAQRLARQLRHLGAIKQVAQDKDKEKEAADGAANKKATLAANMLKAAQARREQGTGTTTGF